MSNDKPNSEREEQASVPYFIHEGVISHMEQANQHMADAHRQMLVAIIAVCVTLVITVGVFVTGYVRNNKDWIRYAEELRADYGRSEAVEHDQR